MPRGGHPGKFVEIRQDLRKLCSSWVDGQLVGVEGVTAVLGCSDGAAYIRIATLRKSGHLVRVNRGLNRYVANPSAISTPAVAPTTEAVVLAGMGAPVPTPPPPPVEPDPEAVLQGWLVKHLTFDVKEAIQGTGLNRTVVARLLNALQEGKKVKRLSRGVWARIDPEWYGEPASLPGYTETK